MGPHWQTESKGTGRMRGAGSVPGASWGQNERHAGKDKPVGVAGRMRPCNDQLSGKKFSDRQMIRNRIAFGTDNGTTDTSEVLADVADDGQPVKKRLSVEHSARNRREIAIPGQDRKKHFSVGN